MIRMLHHLINGDGGALAVAAAAAPTMPVAWISSHRRWSLAILGAVALAAALSLAVYSSGQSAPAPGLAQQSLGQHLAGGLKAVGSTVASLFDSRSPGERSAGALASLKNRRQPALHERALPKVRGPVAPQQASLAAPALVGPPAELPPAGQPLYNVLSGPPEAGPVTLASASAPPLGGVPGGGGLIVGSPGSPGGPGTPSTPLTPSTPGTPNVPGVPEPASWAMMLVGFALMAHFAVARRRSPEATSELR